MIRLIEHPAGSAAWNMAVDQALLESVQAPVLRIYQWSEPALSIGYFQSLTVVPPGRPFVRRYTGGGMVDHAQDVTYSIILPPDHPYVLCGTAESYRTIHQAVVSALLNIGRPAFLAPRCSDVDAAGCFQKPVKFDVVDPHGFKLAGAAQRRSRWGMLHQGSVLVDATPDSLRHSLKTELLKAMGAASESRLTTEEHTLALQLESERYSLDDWNRKR